MNVETVNKLLIVKSILVREITKAIKVHKMKCRRIFRPHSPQSITVTLILSAGLIDYRFAERST